MIKIIPVVLMGAFALSGCNLDAEGKSSTSSEEEVIKLPQGSGSTSAIFPEASTDTQSSQVVVISSNQEELTKSKFEVDDAGKFKQKLNSDDSVQITPRVFDPEYVPLCADRLVNATYLQPEIPVGQLACYHFQVTEDLASTTSQPVKIVARIFGQNDEADYYLRVAQDDPSARGSFPLVLHNPVTGNGEERVTFISDDGHYYLLMDTTVANSGAFNFRIEAIHDYDDQELNENIFFATPLTAETEITGNIDSEFDQDFYSYTTVGTELALQVSADPDAHEFIFSLDGGSTWQAIGQGLWTLNMPSGSTLFFGFRNGSIQDPTAAYTFEIFDDRGVEIHSLVGEIVNAQNRFTGENDLYNSIPGYTYDNYPITGGVVGHFVRFFGQLKIPSPSGLVPAKFRRFRLDWTQTSNGIGSVYFERNLLTDENGWYDQLVFLPECRGGRTHTKKVSGLDPDLWFQFDVDSYHITAESTSSPTGRRQYNTANEYYFNLCQVRENNSSGSWLDPFDYD